VSVFDHASHHTGDVTGLMVIGNGNGGGRIIRVIIGSSLLRGLAVPRTLLWRSDAWAGLSRGLRLASTAGGHWGGGRGRRTSVFVGAIGLGTVVGGVDRGVAVGGISGGAVVGRVGGHVVGVSGHVVGRLGSELRNSGPGELVSSVAESVDEDTGVAVLVGTRESDKFIGAGRSRLTTTDVDLDTGRVELGTSGLISQMKADNLMTKEISTASEVGRELEGMGLSIDCKSSVSNREPKMGEPNNSIH